MPLTNAQKQRRFRDRNVIVLTDRAEDIAEKLMDMEDSNSRECRTYLCRPNMPKETGLAGWACRTRTSEWRNQNPTKMGKILGQF